MSGIVGKRIEFRNVKRDTIQSGVVIDKILYRENNTSDNVVTGYLVKMSGSNDTRIVKTIRVTSIFTDEDTKPNSPESCNKNTCPNENCQGGTCSGCRFFNKGL